MVRQRVPATSRLLAGMAFLALVVVAGIAVFIWAQGDTKAPPTITVDHRAPTVWVIPDDSTLLPTQVVIRQGALTRGVAVETSVHSFSFGSGEAGRIMYGGGCRSTTTMAVQRANTITFDPLPEGTYRQCTVRVRDAAGNVSAAVVVPSFTVYPSPMSTARLWNEVLLSAIRVDRARPPVQARNLFHTSAAMYDIWAAYDGSANPYLLGTSACPLVGDLLLDEDSSVDTAISYAMYRLVTHRFSGSPGVDETTELLEKVMAALGYDPAVTSTDYSDGSAAALGNYVAQCYIDYGLNDGSNEEGLHANTYYQPLNGPLTPVNPGTGDLIDLDRWQPLVLEVFVDQAGNVVIGGAPPFIGAEWGNVTPFAIPSTELRVAQRDTNGDGVMDEFKVYHDPGAPPSHLGPTGEEFWWNFALVAEWSGQLDPADGVTIDISPASQGNDPDAQPSLPETLDEFRAFYDESGGGDTSQGHPLNPITGQPYAPEIVLRGNYARVLAEFWADGPTSETPPGHWFTILNYVTDKLYPDQKRLGGSGLTLDSLEWDVKTYFTLGGAMHDAAISAWSVKGWYDYVRPITAIRAMDSTTVTEVAGAIEIVRDGDALAGPSGENIGKVKIRAWRGPNEIPDPAIDTAGVDWILAEDWWPYQRPTFVTPPFAGYVSGHSTYSRAAADILTAMTGDPYFPGGLATFVARADEFLVFEEGPSETIVLQWATYRDAADQSALSRIWGGIHPPFDDIPGRQIGSLVAADAFDLAMRYFTGTALP
jgi:hypothetical protein